MATWTAAEPGAADHLSPGGGASAGAFAAFTGVDTVEAVVGAEEPEPVGAVGEVAGAAAFDAGRVAVPLAGAAVGGAAHPAASSVAEAATRTVTGARWFTGRRGTG